MLSTLAFLILLSVANAWLILHGFTQTEHAATARSNAGLTDQAQDVLLRQAQAEARATMTHLEQASQSGHIAAEAMLGVAQRWGGVPWNAQTDLQRTPDGRYLDHRAAPVTDLWLSSHLATVDAALERDLRQSATLDGVFPAVMQQDADAQAIYYINDRATFVRYYPLLKPADLLPPDFPMETSSWFTIVTPAANPGHRTVWTAPYIDPATKLPIVTASTPVYDGTVFRGMIGVDLSLQQLVDHLQTLKTTPHGYAVLIDKQGQVVAAPPEAGRDLLGQQAAASVGPLLLGKPLGPLVSPALRQTFGAMLAGKSGVDQIMLNNEATLVSYAPLPDLGWSLAFVTPLREVTGQSEVVGAAIHAGTVDTMRATLLAMIGFFALAIVGIAVLNRRLTRPIDVLMERTRAIAAGDFQAGRAIGGLGGEWGKLAHGFDAMVNAVDQREAQLRESEHRYRTLSEQIPAVIFVSSIDPAEGDLYVSPYIETLFGWTQAEWIAEPHRWSIQLHPDDRTSAVAAMEQLRLRGGTLSHEYRMSRRDGSIIWVSNEIRRVDDENGRPLFFQGVVLDMTDRKHQDLAIRESEARYRALIQTSPDAIIGVNIEGELVFASQQAAANLGYASMDDLIGRYVFDLIAPADHRRVLSHAGIVEEQGSIRNVEYTMVRCDGTSFPAEISISLLHDANGQPTGFIGTARDISARKRSAEILLAKEVAEQASQAKSEFLSRMSHELRTPLNAIMGFAHVLQMESSDLGPDRRESIDHIAGAARHLLHLINEVLDITQVESGQIHLVIAHLPMTDMVQTAFDLVQPLANERGIVLEADPPANRELAVLADEQRVVQVLLSLLVNAIIYNKPQGSVAVRFWEREAVVRIEVIDTGIGIPAAKLDRLFTPFDRLDAEYTTIEGSGLGLALVKRLVEGMQGRVGVTSVVGEGSTFWFELPTRAPVNSGRPARQAIKVS